MRLFRIFLIFSTSCLISSCSTMNSNFSCNATASDQCLTLSEVNAMTEARPQKIIIKEIKPTKTCGETSRRLRIAPWTDNKGVHHLETLVYLTSENSTCA
jgi:hypothetical protein